MQLLTSCSCLISLQHLTSCSFLISLAARERVRAAQHAAWRHVFCSAAPDGAETPAPDPAGVRPAAAPLQRRPSCQVLCHSGSSAGHGLYGPLLKLYIKKKLLPTLCVNCYVSFAFIITPLISVKLINLSLWTRKIAFYFY